MTSTMSRRSMLKQAGAIGAVLALPVAAEAVAAEAPGVSATAVPAAPLGKPAFREIIYGFGDLFEDVFAIFEREYPDVAAGIMVGDYEEMLRDVMMNTVDTVPRKHQLFAVGVLDLVLKNLARDGYGIAVVKRAN